MAATRADIEKAVSETLAFVEDAAIEEYKNGRINTIGKFKKIEYVCVKVEVSRDPGRCYFRWPAGSSKPCLHCDEQSGVFRVLRENCETRGISARFISTKYATLRIEFDVPVGTVRSMMAARKASAEAFAEILRSRRQDVVEKLAEFVLERQASITSSLEFVSLDKAGVIVGDGESGLLELPFASFGLEPIDNDDNIIVLADAIVGCLSDRGHGGLTYAVVRRNYPKSTTCEFRWSKAKPEPRPLSKW